MLSTALAALQAIIILGVLVQFLTEITKGVIPGSDAMKVKYKLVNILALAWGLAICIFCKVDILAMLGFTSVTPLMGYIISGFTVSGGSSGINELIKALTAVKTSTAAITSATSSVTENATITDVVENGDGA